MLLFAAFTQNLLNWESGSAAPTELLLPLYLQFVSGVSEPLAGAGAQLYPALQNEMKASALTPPAPPKGSARGLKQRGQSGRKKRDDAPSPQQKQVLNVNLRPLN